MSDLEMTRLCAEAMGLTVWSELATSGKLLVDGRGVLNGGVMAMPFDPLHDDAQAMQLVKRFDVCLMKRKPGQQGAGQWLAHIEMEPDGETVCNTDLNRAIVKAVAKMQGANHG